MVGQKLRSRNRLPLQGRICRLTAEGHHVLDKTEHGGALGAKKSAWAD